MKRTVFLFAGIGLALGLFGAGTFVRSDTKDDQSEEINRLQQERLDVLKQVVEMVENAFQSGGSGFGSLVQASSQLLNAELDMAKDHVARLGVLQRQVELFESWVKLAKSRYEAGAVPQTEILSARAAVLEFRIRLLREQGEGK